MRQAFFHRLNMRYFLAKQAAQHEQNQHGLSPDVLAQQRQKGLDLLQQAQAELAGQTVDTVMDELAKAVLQALLNDLTRQFQGCSSGEPYYAPLLKANTLPCIRTCSRAAWPWPGRTCTSTRKQSYRNKSYRSTWCQSSWKHRCSTSCPSSKTSAVTWSGNTKR